MLKAQKLGPQATQDFLNEQLPRYAFTMNQKPFIKDQTYWSKKGSYFDPIKFDRIETNPINYQDVQRHKNDSYMRQRKSQFKRTVLQMKSGQIFGDLDDKAQQVVQHTPVHLYNNIDNAWNHLELTDKKHLQFIYGAKSIERQKKAIEMIDQKIDADFEVEKLRAEALSNFRLKRLGRPSFGKNNNQFQINKRYQRCEFQNMLLTQVEPLDEFNSNILYCHIQKHLPMEIVGQQQNKTQKYQKNRSKSLQTQNTQFSQQTESSQIINSEVSEQIDLFEDHLRQTQGNNLRKRTQEY